MLIYHRLTTCKMDQVNLWTVLVLASLAWWNLCDAFFYVAKTKEMAWFWHRLGAPGWCGFIAVTGWYFVVMTELNQKLPKLVKAVLVIPPVFLVVRFLAASPTALAADLVPSGIGLGWTYVPSFHTIWPYLFIAYLLFYMGGSLFYLYLWQRTVKNKSSRYLAKGFLLLDTFVVLLGAVSIFVLPSFTNYLPPAGCISTLIFGVWYWNWLRDYDFIHVELALNPGVVLESCIDAMVVLDEEYRLLYANSKAQNMLGEDCRKGDIFPGCLVLESRESLKAFFESESFQSGDLNLELVNGIQVICSISFMSSRKRGVNVSILCMKDISQMKKIQEKLDYLVHYDDLTGLYNRRFLKKELEEWEQWAVNSGEDFELLFLDLTRFKQINDTYGHDAGDAALVAVARALAGAVGPEDVLARFAGDEFVVLHRCKDQKDMTALLQKAVRSIDSQSFAPDIHMNPDIGISRFSETRDTAAMIRLADSRMYELKQSPCQAAETDLKNDTENEGDSERNHG